MNGFFSLSELSSGRKAIPLLPQCGKCQLFEGCKSPKIPVDGQGQKKILIIGEAPGADEDDCGKPFVGPAGQLLQKYLAKIGIDLRRDCWITNSCICRPKENKLPPKAIGYCRPNLIDTIKKLKSNVIIPLGGTAIESLLGWLWKEKVGAIGRWVGWQIPCQSINAWICPTWHPSYLQRMGGGEGTVQGVLFENHLRAASKLEGRPWQEVLNWKKEVFPVMDSGIACMDLKQFIKEDKPIAFDIETTCLKPDSKQAEIVSCSVSDGNKTISFPWTSDSIVLIKELLESKTPKIGYNSKFETRWMFKQGINVRNWIWDGMLAAHILDNRPGICGLKFQSFVQLGIDSWDDAIKPFLQAEPEGGNNQNRIRQVNLEKVLVYGAIDSLVEYKIAELQMKKMGVKI